MGRCANWWTTYRLSDAFLGAENVLNRKSVRTRRTNSSYRSPIECLENRVLFRRQRLEGRRLRQLGRRQQVVAGRVPDVTDDVQITATGDYTVTLPATGDYRTRSR
jgi:hypothetical protein